MAGGAHPVLDVKRCTAPRVGTRRRGRLAESLGAIDVALTPGVFARIEAAIPCGDAAAADRALGTVLALALAGLRAGSAGR